MKRQAALFLIVYLMATAIAAGGTEKPQEIRGMWVDSWGVGLKSPDQVTAMVDFAAIYGFTDVFVQIRKRGDAYYDSALEPRAWDIPEGFDPLADVVKKAHDKGVKVHAWVMMYNAWTGASKQPPPEGHVFLTHPEWFTENTKGEKVYLGDKLMYLDPGVPEVADHLTRIVEDIAREYKVDGIHIDGLRYCDKAYGYNPRSVALFNAEYKREGVPPPEDEQWCDWRRAQVTKLASRLPKAIHNINPSITVSVAAYYNFDDIRLRFFQDWPTWGKERYYDFIVPMTFVPKTVEDFIRMVDREIEAAAPTPCLIGQGAWRFPIQTTNRHLRVIRGKATAGFIIFDYGYLSTKNKKTGKCPADMIDITEHGKENT